MAITVEQTDNPSEHVRKRASNMTAEVIAHVHDHEWFVGVKVFTEKGKVDRIVQFHRKGNSIERITCFAEESLRNCPANQSRKLCSHVYAAILHLMDQYKEKHRDESEESESTIAGTH